MVLRSRHKTILTTAVLAMAWSGAVAFGLRTLVSYESTPGATGKVAQHWPDQSKIQRAPDRPTLLMLAHPLCPCTEASMDELARVLARTPGKARAYVLFLTPNNSAQWEDTALRRRAEAIPGLAVVSDPDGAEAKRFGAETSGHTLLFGADGRLLFSGGITASRGHAGGNNGESAIVSLLQGDRVDRASSFVFGCALRGSEQKGDRKKCSR